MVINFSCGIAVLDIPNVPLAHVITFWITRGEGAKTSFYGKRTTRQGLRAQNLLNYLSYNG